jgi:protoporphyrinogen oxidase
MTREIAVLGSGMAAMGAAHRLRGAGVNPVVYDARSHYGGHTASYVNDGFVFDEGPHISFTKDPRIQQLLADNVNGAFEIIHARVNNYWRGQWIKHPAQCNLHGLPVELTVKIIAEMVAAQHRDPGSIRNYEEWLVASYGRPFAETFPMQYGRKYHTTEAANMSTDWLGPRLYRPSIEEVLAGALSPSTPDVHYISEFRYPSHGGFVSFLRPFTTGLDLRLNHRVTALDPRARSLTFADGRTVAYEQVVSSIPLPELVPLMVGAPPAVVAGAARLACSTCVIVNIGLDRRDISDWHWTYFYDDDFSFSRLSFPHMLSPHNAPPDAGSIQAEIYFSSKYKPLDCSLDDCVDTAILDLRRCGLLRDADTILYRGAVVAPYANIIFDLERHEALAQVHAYLDEVGVRYCGRYGEWGYQWTDEAFLSGERAAQQVLDRVVAGKGVS